MDIDPDVLGNEVASLCARAAARGPAMRKRVRPQLDRVCDITERDLPSQLAPKLASTLERLLRDHAGEKELLLVALGLHPKAPQSTLERRLDWLARERHVATRTLQRRLPEAIDLFTTAAVAASRASSAPDDVGYVTDHFDGTVDRMGERATVVERRKISVIHQRLDLLQCWRGLARPLADGEHQITVQLADGALGQLKTRQRGDVLDYFIPLPEPLEAGQVYEFKVVHELPVRVLRPFYILHPCAPFGSASLTVKFDPRQVPRRAWRVDSGRPGEFETCPSDAKQLFLDPSAALRVTFQDLREGRSYGMAWAWE